MKDRFVNLYMDWAKRVAEMSYAQRLKVGAVIVKDDSVISYGYNGTPAGWDNNCEDKDWMTTARGWLNSDEIRERWPFEETVVVANDNESFETTMRYRLKTKPEVMHAERNALDKLAKHGGVGGKDASMFITHAPCIECAKSIYSAGISHVYYHNSYRDTAGLVFLEKCGIKVEKVS